MKNIRTKILAAVLALAALAAFAGQVYDRQKVTLGSTTGSATFTNSVQYSALKLVRIWADNSLAALNTVTVTRVLSDGSFTNAVGTIELTANKGSTATFTAAYLAYGDKLVFSSLQPTGSTVIVEYEVQQH